jgi:hypothetical protein
MLWRVYDIYYPLKEMGPQREEREKNAPSRERLVSEKTKRSLE